ncbi:MAG: enoyl-CoA hydratase [Pseudomonadota bacterium]
MSDYTQLLYDAPAPHVARITLNRPARMNAQGPVMTYELDAAFKRACHDEAVHVIILAAAGKHFCAGHDLSADEAGSGARVAEPVGLWGDAAAPGWEGAYTRERELYLDITERWRSAPKPTIAAVQGAVVAGGLMLAWACDLIVCAEDARFRDNTAAELGIPGVELFQHPFELGARRAKEWLLTGDWLSAADAKAIGMVNHVVPKEDLAAAALRLAEKIAANDRFAMKLAKQAINQAQDLMGRRPALEAAFSLHQVAHLHSMLVNGAPIDTSRLPASLRAQVEAALAEQSAARDTPKSG